MIVRVSAKYLPSSPQFCDERYAARDKSLVTI